LDRKQFSVLDRKQLSALDQIHSFGFDQNDLVLAFDKKDSLINTA